MSGNTRRRGRQGEDAVREKLLQDGLEFIDAGYLTRFGEIDLIFRDGECIVFIEVKLRKNREYGDAREYVTPAKQKRLRQTALIWLSANAPDAPARFDVAEVYQNAENGGTADIIYIENAFQ